MPSQMIFGKIWHLQFKLNICQQQGMSRDRIFDNNTSFTKYFQEKPPQVKSKKETERPHLYKFSQINTFLQKDRPKLSQQKLRMIQDKLSLDKQAQINADYRIREENLFYKYSYNPFTYIKQKQIVQQVAPPPQKIYQIDEQVKNKDKYDEKDINIVDAIHKFKGNNSLQVSKEINDHIKLIQNIPHDFLNNVKNYKFPFEKAGQKQAKIQQDTKETTFYDILNMQDQNFFAKNQHSLNIFHIIKGNAKNILTNRILDKYYFDFTSIIQKSNIMKFPTFRELSRAGRNCIVNKPFKKQKRLQMISSLEMTLNLEDIKFEHLLSISSGRYTPEICEQIINQGQIRKQMLINQHAVSKAKIIYNQNTNQFLMNFENNKMDRQEIIDYLNLQNTPVQQQFAKKCHRIYKDAQQKIQKKSHLLSNTIADRKLHQQLSKQIQQDLQLLIGMDKRVIVEPDRLIRVNKNTKNRRENIKIKTLLNSIVLKNNQQELISQLINHSKK